MEMSELSSKNREFCSASNFSKLLEPVAGLLNNETGKTYDYGARKITFEPFFKAMVLFSLTPEKRLGALQKSMAKSPLFELCQAKIEVSVPALSAANATRPLDGFVEILAEVLARIGDLPGDARIMRNLNSSTLSGITDLLTRTRILDSTSLELPPKVAEWARRSEKQKDAGVKVHLKLDAGYGGLEKIILSTSRANDARYFRELLDLKKDKGAIYLFDSQYKEVKVFDEITSSGNFLVGKLHSQVGYTVLEEQDLGEMKTSCGYTLYRRMVVTLGSKPNRSGSEHKYVLLEVSDTAGTRGILVTNMPDAAPEQVCALYLYRWTIETCFRWLKRTLQTLKFISYSPRGVMMLLMVALIVYGLLVLYQSGRRRFGLASLLVELRLDMEQALYNYGYEQGMRAAGQQV